MCPLRNHTLGWALAHSSCSVGARGGREGGNGDSDPGGPGGGWSWVQAGAAVPAEPGTAPLCLPASLLGHNLSGTSGDTLQPHAWEPGADWHSFPKAEGGRPP